MVAKSPQKKVLDLLCRCNEVGAETGFIKITLDDEDPVAAAFILSCEEVPTRREGLGLYTVTHLKIIVSYSHAIFAAKHILKM